LYDFIKRESSPPMDNRDEDSGTLVVDPDPPPEEKVLTLYFKHEISDNLVPEKRVVFQKSQSIEQLVVEELLKGPKGFQRTTIMPNGVKLIDVSRKSDIVFVNLSKEFRNDIDLSLLPDKANVSEEDRPRVLKEMKRLAIYSIVNSLTEIDGVNQVKFLVENRPCTYSEIGAELLMGGVSNIDENSAMVAISRNKHFILSPSKAVEQVLLGMVGEPNWERVYAFLDTDHESIPSSLDEFKKFITAKGITLEVDENPIDGEEIKPDGEAFVTAHYTVKYPNGQKVQKNRDLITVVNKDGIWKVRLPEAIING